MNNKVKGRFKISYIDRHGVIARLTFGLTSPNSFCYSGHAALTWKKVRWEVPKLLPT